MDRRLRFIYVVQSALLDVHQGFVWPYLCLLLASVYFYCRGVAVYLIFERLGVDFDLPSCPSDLQQKRFQL